MTDGVILVILLCDTITLYCNDSIEWHTSDLVIDYIDIELHSVTRLHFKPLSSVLFR